MPVMSRHPVLALQQQSGRYSVGFLLHRQVWAQRACAGRTPARADPGQVGQIVIGDKNDVSRHRPADQPIKQSVVAYDH